MPGNRKPNRERSRQGSYRHKFVEKVREYNAKIREYDALRLNVAKYQEAINQLAVSASNSSRRVGMMTQIAVTCRKHFASFPHANECASIVKSIPEVFAPCDCGHDAILQAIDNSLKEPDFGEDKATVEIKDLEGNVKEVVQSETIAPDTTAGV